MQELFEEQETLVSEEEWNRRLAALREKRDESIEFSQAFTHAVLERCPEGRVGVLFSGGLDSTLIAFLLRRHGTPLLGITVGFQDEGTKEPEDILEAKKAAKLLGCKYRTVLLDKEGAHKLFARTAKMLGPALANPVTVGVGAVELAGLLKARQLRLKTCFSGLGSEELFAGYDRHEKANSSPEALHEECWRGLGAMHARDLMRTEAIARETSRTVATPFLDPRVIVAAMQIPAGGKILTTPEETIKKYALRIIAEELGLPHDFAFRPKRAAQYGSRLDAAMEKLARIHGFSSKTEYVKSFFR